MEDHLIVNGQDQLSLARCITRFSNPTIASQTKAAEAVEYLLKLDASPPPQTNHARLNSPAGTLELRAGLDRQ